MGNCFSIKCLKKNEDDLEYNIIIDNKIVDKKIKNKIYYNLQNIDSVNRVDFNLSN